MNHPLAHRLPFALHPDVRRVLIRPFLPGDEPRAHHPADVPRALKIMTRILSLPDSEVAADWKTLVRDFGARHPDLDSYFLRRFEAVKAWLPSDAAISKTRRKLIGAYFTHEYSLEAAALFNPSIVMCPDQSGLPDGSVRFILSLRSVGEGHISSITFRCGTLDEVGNIDMGEPARWVVGAEPQVNPSFSAEWFTAKCKELGQDSGFLHIIQMGNCGSPLETEAGWLVLTHGVGAMRKYCIGAILLDLNDPTRIIGRLAEPLIRPGPEEREGYVPNVVYSCGGLIHARHLFLPYATSDWFTSFAWVPLDDLLAAMQAV